MLAPSSVVKATAKTAMRGRFLKCILVSAVFVFAALISISSAQLISYVTPFAAVYYIVLFAFAFFVLMPLFLGLLRFFRRMLWGEDDSPVLVFHYLSSRALYLRALKFGLFLGIRLTIVALLLYLPSIIVDVFTGTALYDMLGIPMPLWISNFWVISVFLRAAAGAAFFFVAIKWYLAPFLYVADEDMDALEAIHMSSIISRGTALDFFLLILSFTLWILFSLFMIPIVFTLPYFISAYIVHCRYAVAQYNRVVEHMMSEDTPSFAAEV